MTSRNRLIRVAGFLCCLLATHCSLAADGTDSTFRGVLELAEIGPEVFAAFSDTSDYAAEDWQFLIRLRHRLGQTSAAQQDAWAQPWNQSSEQLPGNLFEVVGTLESVETLSLPKPLAQTHNLESLYRCRFLFNDVAGGQPKEGILLSSQIPAGWQKKQTLDEPIRFRGILLKISSEESPAVVFFSTDVAWYPRQGVSTGQLLLARQEFDVALLDEVRHRRPFVEADVSREGEAFYGCLAAMKRVDDEELSVLAQQSVIQLAEQWRDRQAKDGQQRALIAAVQERSELGLSSVAPLFLEPEQMTGKLVRLEGTARRAVKIAVDEYPGLNLYYELEVFLPDSKNLPVVCCVNELPAGFPTGDSIREPVRISGLFFKSWLYRSRKVNQREGETGRQRRMYTPIVVAGTPRWLNKAASQERGWGLVGGIVFLAVLVVIAFNMVRLASKDRRARAARPRLDVSDIK